MRLLIFELNTFHLELFPMYAPLMPALFGERALDLHYYVPPALKVRARAMVGHHVSPLYPTALRYPLGPTACRALAYRLRVPQIVRRLAPDAVVLNTAEPAPYLQLFGDLKHPLKIGIMHNPKRGRLASRGSDPATLWFCLHEYNFRALREELPVDGYLSPFFRCTPSESPRVSSNAIELAVQGVISFGRRDYPSLIEVARQLRARSPERRVVFNVLGDASIRDGPRLSAMVTRHGLQPYFKLHGWLPDNEFFQELQRAHYLLPLLAPDTGPYAGGAKVSAAFGHSGAYGIPLLVHTQVAEQWGVPPEACVTYRDTTDLAGILTNGHLDRETATGPYRRWIDSAIERNRDHLRRLAAEHPALAAVRS